jgi:hypothetical protein
MDIVQSKKGVTYIYPKKRNFMAIYRKVFFIGKCLPKIKDFY